MGNYDTAITCTNHKYGVHKHKVLLLNDDIFIPSPITTMYFYISMLYHVFDIKNRLGFLVSASVDIIPLNIYVWMWTRFTSIYLVRSLIG
jgi:hypothetical protein